VRELLALIGNGVIALAAGDLLGWSLRTVVVLLIGVFAIAFLTRVIELPLNPYVVAFCALCLGVLGIGLWELLAWYIDPKDAADRKNLVQVFALLLAGIVGAIGALVGLASIYFSRRNLEHNQAALEHNRKALLQERELEKERVQDAALQAYYEQMGTLLTEKELVSKGHTEIRELARVQTLTVADRIDSNRKRLLLLFWLALI
jgi:hypothetical protein